MAGYLSPTVLILCFISVACEGAVIRVPEHYDRIQQAVDAAGSGDTVLIASGTYTGFGNRDINFSGKAITVKSETGPESVVIDCAGNHDDPHRGFIFQNGEGPDSRLEGITVKNGYAFGFTWPDNYGGGIYISSASPLINDCILHSNEAAYFGGGVYCTHNCSPTLNRCIITENTSGYHSGGGGIYCDNGTELVASNCIISGNSSDWDGGGICVVNSSPSFINCVIQENYADYHGGAAHCYASDPTFFNCLVTENVAAYYGAGISCFESSPFIMQCTFSLNASPYGSGIECQMYSNPVVKNSILWEDIPDEIFCDAVSSPSVTFSDIQDGYQGQGNINSDPLFTQGALGNYYLSQIICSQYQESPCIDGGHNSAENVCMNTIEGISCMDEKSTGCLYDEGPADMGYHYNYVEQPIVPALHGPGKALILIFFGCCIAFFRNRMRVPDSDSI